MPKGGSAFVDEDVQLGVWAHLSQSVVRQRFAFSMRRIGLNCLIVGASVAAVAHTAMTASAIRSSATK
jgi:hypothetical protein